MILQIITQITLVEAQSAAVRKAQVQKLKIGYVVIVGIVNQLVDTVNMSYITGEHISVGFGSSISLQR